MYTRFLYLPWYNGLSQDSKFMILRRLSPRHGFDVRELDDILMSRNIDSTKSLRSSKASKAGYRYKIGTDSNPLSDVHGGVGFNVFLTIAAVVGNGSSFEINIVPDDACAP